MAEFTVKNIHDLFEDKARGGDGAFAVAFALLELADAQKQTAKALDRLGFNSDGKDPGPTEKIAMEMERIANALHDRNSN